MDPSTRNVMLHLLLVALLISMSEAALKIHIARVVITNDLDKDLVLTIHCRSKENDLDDSKKTENLFALDGAKEKLHLFKADLLEESSFDSAVDGCEGVFHTASPVSFSITDPQAELIDPALKGTLNVLKSCAKFPSIKRVIVTSSMASVMRNGQPLNPDVVVDETWFSDPALCEKLKKWYPLSKTLAEKAAWNFSKENGIDLVVMNPGFTIGPTLQPTLSPSIEVILNLINDSIRRKNASSSVDAT